jgi:DNA gyrase subunit A
VVLSDFASVRPSGLIAITLDEGDELGWVRLTRGDDEIILVTRGGQALRFSEKQVRYMGRTAAGVIGIRLKQGDFVTGMEVVEPDADLLVVTEKGFGKRTPLKEYVVKNRANVGVHTINKRAINQIGAIAAARVVQEDDDLTLISAGGVVLRTKVEAISRSSRATRGVTIMNLQEGDSVASVARIAHAELRRVGATE